ncbi:MAG: helix-turn-helix protein [Conexibacter sp.]|nr:helix-turn-helix protein [Conexibacter sp.]
MFRGLSDGSEAATCATCKPGGWTGDARPLIETLPDLSNRITLSKSEAADLLGVSVDYLEQRIVPELRVVSKGARVLIPRAELERWVESSAARALQGR